MKKHILGNSNVSVSEQVFGCWAIGGTYFTGAKDELSIAAIRQAIDSGITGNFHLIFSHPGFP